MRSKSYSIPVNPITWQKGFSKGTRLFDNQSRDHIIFHLSLQKQHGEEPLFNGALKIECYFYIRTSKNKPKSACKNHIYAPGITELYKFLIEAMKGVIISDDRTICELILHKAYDNNARTELTITEVD